ncbi:MAG: flagellar basal body P-ring formation protein FlgA [Candidatus Margulisbacteria bacterium]|nr:flagellar basal body P-ring formation protein FlgA [Candidatus Margulisiibacteriota bacterium]
MKMALLLVLSLPAMAIQLSCDGASDLIKKNVLAQIEARYSAIDFNDLTIEAKGTEFPEGCDVLSFEWPKKMPLAGDIIIKFDAFENDNFKKRITKVFRIRGSANVMAVKHRAVKGDKVGAHNLEQKEIPLAALTPHSISRIGEGLQFRRYVDAGEIIESWMIEKMPDVVKGDAVTAIVQRNAITLTLDAEVLQNGSVGDNVKLQLKKNNKVLLGMLHDKKTVIISSL